MTAALETDYLVIGAGAAGLSFTDALIDADPGADVIMVDRRHAAVVIGTTPTRSSGSTRPPPATA